MVKKNDIFEIDAEIDSQISKDIEIFYKGKKIESNVRRITFIIFGDSKVKKLFRLKTVFEKNLFNVLIKGK